MTAQHDEHESVKMGDMDHDHTEHSGHEDHAGHDAHAGHEVMFRKRFWVSLLLSIPVLLYSESIQGWLGYTAPVFPGSQWIVPAFSTLIFIYGGLPFLRMSLMELRKRQPGMMTLISLAIIVAYVYSMAVFFLGSGQAFFWELVTLIDIMLLGHWLEMRSIRQASGALDALAKLLPDTAEVIMSNGKVMEHPVSDLKTGDRVLVRPGASVPADGRVVDGETTINEAMITGESKPVDKGTGDDVIAGTVNSGDGSLRVEVTAVGDDTALSGIMRLVDEAQKSKSSTQLLADRAAAWLFYTALAAAVVTAVAWTLINGFSAQVVARVVTVLVIACPHALGLAIPLVVANTTSLAAKNGILIRDRQSMETAKDLDVITFDKTGTLTKGEFGVVDMAVAGGVTADEALAEAAGIEGDSEHLIAQAIRNSAEAKELAIPDVADFKVLKGRGVAAGVNGHMTYVGGPRLLEYLDAERPSKLADFAAAAGDKGQSVVYLVRDDQAVAAFALADIVRLESKKAIDELHDMDVEVAMLTGDSQEVADAVAQELDIDQVFAQVLPEDKDSKIIELQKQGNKVGMVGDGVNDAPALARADVGIAIGSGTDVAVESAGLILVQSNPLDVVKILKLSEASYRKQVQNIWWAAGYNIIMIPLAMGVLAPWGIVPSPAVGALLMSISTIIVAINAQTLRGVDLNIS
ncbi:MAG: heavy metal translocating P-type ATPase [Candidatus Promineifilaceae bacterium]|jgi:Cu2+-exporting ATPase